MKEVQEIIQAAKKRGHRTLSEYDSKRVLKSYGIPVVKEVLVQDLAAVNEAASLIGYPLVLKACSPEVTHKTEKGLIEVNLRDEEDLAGACKRLRERIGEYEGDFLLQEMVKGTRELVIGMIRDPLFGPSVMFGLGGIFTEILQDVSFRVAPVEMKDAKEMVREIRGHKILEAVRGLEAVDLDLLSRSLMVLGEIGLEHEAIQGIDVNPLIVQGNRPVAVDALIVLAD